MRVALAFALALFAQPAIARAVPNDPPAFPCAGRWRGLGRTTGFDTAWTIDMVVTAPGAGGSCGTIEYTRPTCGGRIVECSVAGGQVRVREVYTHNDGRCAPPGRLEFRCEGERMQWAWIGWETARTTLTRVGPAPDTTNRGSSRVSGVAPPASPRPIEPEGSTGLPGRTPRASEADDGGSLGCVATPRARPRLAIALVALVAIPLVVRRRRSA